MNNGSMTVDKTSAAYQKNLIRTARYNLLVVMVFTVLNLVMLLVGAFLPVDAVWSLADILCALMTFPNLLGLLFLSPKIFTQTL